MRLFPIFLFGLYSSQSVAVSEYCQDYDQLSEQMKPFNETLVQIDCCKLSDGQWELIAWLFSRVGSHINVTEIVRESDPNQHGSYINHFMKDLYDYTGLKYVNVRVEYSSEVEGVDKMNPHPTNPYIWHSEFEINENDTTHSLEDDKEYLRSKLLKQNRQREDEPEFGNVVLASDIKIIDHFTNGLTRNPFKSRRTHYVLIIYSEFDGGTQSWDKIVSRILAKLWKGHSVLNVILLSTCTPKYVSFELIEEFSTELICISFE